MKYIIARLREPSSHAGLALIYTQLPKAIAGDWTAIAAVASAAIAIFVPESTAQ